jgi:hypothetical protein
MTPSLDEAVHTAEWKVRTSWRAVTIDHLQRTRGYADPGLVAALDDRIEAGVTSARLEATTAEAMAEALCEKWWDLESDAWARDQRSSPHTLELRNAVDKAHGDAIRAAALVTTITGWDWPGVLADAATPASRRVTTHPLENPARGW